MQLEWTEQNNGNYKVKTPSGSSLLIFRVKDEFDYPYAFKWRAERHDGRIVWGDRELKTLEDAQQDLLTTIKVKENEHD